MLDNYQFTVEQRFLKYVTFDTQSDSASPTSPSTAKQKILGRFLADELTAMGVADAHLDEFGIVYATIPSNTDKKLPVLCYCAHMDTSPDSSGLNVKPIVHRNYNGEDIMLPDDTSQIISTEDHPYLKQKTGDDIITASGTTLLGADDKAGIAVIMDFTYYLITHPETKHGAIRILFTPDEEIGRGVDNVNMQKLAADFGYTLDGGEAGAYEDENFSADGVTITIHGVSAHPGYAKDKLVNAIKIASTFIETLPNDSYSPETTEHREGFFHPVRMNAIAETATIDFIIRDFSTRKLGEFENYLRDRLDEVLLKYPGSKADFKVTEQYRNMKEVLDNYPQVSEYARKAILRTGIIVINHPARGGTDGCRLSFMGMPCPNLFTGEMAFHGKHEYVSVQDMQKSVETIVHLAMIWEERS
ncbi:MAG: peptidase T [Flavitalea sp.]